MKRNLDILDGILSDTKENKISWVKVPKPQKTWSTFNIYWKGEKTLTNAKKIIFFYKTREDFDEYETSYCELEVFFVNFNQNSRELIKVIEPGILSFRSLNRIKKLNKLLLKFEEEKRKAIIGPMPAKNFDEVVY